MSRYTKKIQSGETIVWGFDRPLSEYYLQLYDKEDKLNFSISNYYTIEPHPKFPQKIKWSTGELLELIEKENYKEHIPKEHLQYMIADLPF